VWYRPDAPRTRALWRPGDAGRRLLLVGRVLDTAGAPVAGARVEVWHADAGGVVHEDRYRATLESDRDGRFRVSTVLPGYIWGPRHVHVVVTRDGYRRLVTRLFFRRDPEVATSGRPDLAIVLEDGDHDGEPALFGDVELVMGPGP
jgi:catechol 1,2-dioxygenase